MTLVPTNESKEKSKNSEKLWSKITDLIRSVTKNSGGYDEKFITIKFNSDGELPLNKSIEIIDISIYFYLIKHKAKEKRVLPFYVTNNELKKFFINNNLL